MTLIRKSKEAPTVIAGKILKYRRKHGLTVRQMARRMTTRWWDCDFTGINKIETGRTKNISVPMGNALIRLGFRARDIWPEQHGAKSGRKAA